MYNSNIPKDTDVPSSAKLIKSTILAAVTAGILLVTVVMPAEYGIDPTGAGKVLGLTRMGEIKTSLAKEAEADAVMDNQVAVIEASEPEPISVATQSEEVEISLDPDEARKLK